MATTEKTYTGDGSTVLYSFTFPYIDETDVYVTLDGTVTTAYIYANATTIQFNTAPASGVAIRIYRVTDSSDTKAAFFAGSAIRSKDLNDNFTQTLYISQESENLAGTAETVAAAAQTSAAAATSAATQASTDAASAISTANSATTTANSATTTANATATTVSTYVHDGTNPAGDGVGGNPQGLAYALNQAASAVATANAASSAVALAAFYDPIAALANLPASPNNQDRVEVANSTGVDTSSVVSGVPSGFVGATDLTVRLQYNSSTSKWEWQNYFAADPETRYAPSYLPVIKGDGTTSGQVGKITLNCSNNNHGVSIQSPPHSAAASYTLTLPDNDGNVDQVLRTDGSGNLSWVNQTSPADVSVSTANTFTATQTFSVQSVHSAGIDSNGTIDLDGSLEINGAYKQTVKAVSGTSIDLSTGNYFTKTISGNTSFSFTGAPSAGTVGSFILELTHTSGTVSFPSTVKFPADEDVTANLTTGKTHLFMFVTDDGGSRYRGAVLKDYTN